MKNQKTIVTLVAAVFVFILASSTPSLAAETHKIGFSGAITGTTSDVGVPYSKAIEDYCRFVNDEKLLGDDTLECLIKDDGYETEKTKRNFEDFLDEGIVFYLNYSTGSSLAMGKDFDEEKIPTITASYHAGNLDVSNYAFLPIVSYTSQALALADYLVCRSSPTPARRLPWPITWLPITKGTPPRWPCSFTRPPSAGPRSRI
jgi:branched-chain amino acid transport system substrate-binding protein